MAGKISEYTNAVATFADGDLIDVSKRISATPPVFQSQKLEFTQFQAFIQANASNILNTNGLTLGGSFSHNLNSNTLTFTNGTLNIDSNIILNANVNAPNLPTASAGLSAGDFWNDSGVVRVGTSVSNFLKKSVGTTYNIYNLLAVTQAEYVALTPDADTIYFIV